MTRQHRSFTPEFKLQSVKLYENGKSRADIRNNYGTRKIKKELAKLSKSKKVSRRRIGPLMNEMGLVSNYTVV